MVIKIDHVIDTKTKQTLDHQMLEHIEKQKIINTKKQANKHTECRKSK